MVFAHFHAFLSCEHVFSSDFILPISGKQNSFNPVRQIARNTPLPQFGIIIDQYAENNEARISVGNWLAMFAESQGQLNDYESERVYSEVEDIATANTIIVSAKEVKVFQCNFTLLYCFIYTHTLK